MIKDPKKKYYIDFDDETTDLLDEEVNPPPVLSNAWGSSLAAQR